MTILWLLGVVILCALIWWLIGQAIPAPWQRLAKIVLVVVGILILAQWLGLLGALNEPLTR